MLEIKGAQDYLIRVQEELELFIDAIEMEQIAKACQLILDVEDRNGRIHVSGVGKPSYVAGYIASLLSSTGTPAYFLDATEAIHGSSGQIKKGDVVIAISNSGATEELSKAVETLKANGAYIIAVTGNKESRLYHEGCIQLYAGVHAEGDTLNKPPRASILAEILMLQSLSIMLQNAKQITKLDYVKWHPGGTLGLSILEEVKK